MNATLHASWSEYGTIQQHIVCYCIMEQFCTLTVPHYTIWHCRVHEPYGFASLEVIKYCYSDSEEKHKHHLKSENTGKS